jgi:hypothetical protein
MEEHPNGDGVGHPPDEGPAKGVEEEEQYLHEMCMLQRVGPVGIEKAIKTRTSSQAISLCIGVPLEGISSKDTIPGVRGKEWVSLTPTGLCDKRY